VQQGTGFKVHEERCAVEAQRSFRFCGRHGLAVTIQVPALWRSAAGETRQVELPSGNLADVLNALVEQFPSLGAHLFDEKGEVRSAINLFVNQEHVRFRGGLSMLLQDGDEVYIVPMISGGRR